jgi:hypothetical protein
LGSSERLRKACDAILKDSEKEKQRDGLLENLSRGYVARKQPFLYWLWSLIESRYT